MYRVRCMTSHRWAQLVSWKFRRMFLGPSQLLGGTMKLPRVVAFASALTYTAALCTGSLRECSSAPNFARVHVSVLSSPKAVPKPADTGLSDDTLTQVAQARPGSAPKGRVASCGVAEGPGVAKEGHGLGAAGEGK